MDFQTFSTLVRQLYEHKMANDAYIRPLPLQLQELMVTNPLAESLYTQQALLGQAAFGEHWPDVRWFLEDWKPGFEIQVRVDQPPAPTCYVINSLEDYLDYARRELFETVPGPSH